MKSQVILLFLLCVVAGQTSLFCQVDNDTTFSTLKNDYYEKEREILDIDEAFLDDLYRYKININAFKEFNIIGINLKELPYKFATMTNFKENSLYSDYVIIGTVLKREYDAAKYDSVNKTLPAFYGSTLTIQIDKVLLGNDLYSDQPEQILIKRESGLFSSSSIETVPLEIGKKYIFFLTRKPLENLKKNLHNFNTYEAEKYLGRYTFPNDDVLDNKSVFLEFPYSSLTIKSNFVYDRFGNLLPNLDLLIKVIRQIDKINDRSNFYNRDYKIKSRK